MTTLKNYSPVSITLIALSIAVAAMSGLGSSMQALRILFIADPGHSGLTDIYSGQVWRLVTPMFIHFGFLHLVFNMLWVWDLGAVIENKKSPGFLTGFVLAVAAISNLAQYLLTQSPFFGGMSGVVYGLFSYVWIRGRYDSSFSSGMRRATVHMMLAWFVLCWTGLLGPIANWAHTTGLVIGAVWAYCECRLNGSTLLSATGSVAGPQNLEYLSAADILKIEAQRSWVREQYSPEVRGQFDTVTGKLKIIHALLQQKPADTCAQHEVQAIEIVFADALIQETGVMWAIINDDYQRVPVLASANAPLLVFPVVPVSRLAQAAGLNDLQELFDATAHMIRQALQERV